MKKTLSFFLTLIMVLTLACSVSAAETGSVTISGVSLDENGRLGTKVYSVYQILNLESYDTASGAYSYKAVDAWKAFFISGEGAEYFSIDDADYVTIKGQLTDSDMPIDSDMAKFAKKALAYAQEKNIAPVATTNDATSYSIGEDSEGNKTLKFAGLPLGYYLVDSTVGALCGLTTTNPDAVITAKNTVPTINKQVQEDLGEKWGESNTADIGQIVNFMTDIHV